MTTLNTLKLVSAKKHLSVSPIVLRRNKLIKMLHEQLEIVEAKATNSVFAPKVIRTIVNKQSGEKMRVEVTKRIKEWFWVNESGKINLIVKYGTRTLQLNKKGANAIEVNNGSELINTIKQLKTAVLNGELDEAIEEVSNMTKKGFGK